MQIRTYHGKGTDEVQRLIWLFSRPAFAHLKTELDQLYNKKEKMVIKELTASRIKEDTKDILNILQYIENHDPFKVQSLNLVDISTGISYPNANAHKALDSGNAILKKMDGVEVKKYKFKKVDKIIQMGESDLVDKDKVVIEPIALYERALVIADISDITKKEIFEHELSLYPPSLFGGDGLLRTAEDKSNLTDNIAQLCAPESTAMDKNNLQIERTVLDMGSMLRTKVNFSKGDTYGEIIQKYVNAIQM